jgi:hypothetical protein
MPPLGWRKAVDGAKGKKSANQTDLSPGFNKPPLVPERTGITIEALGGTSLGIGNTLLRPTERSKLSRESHLLTLVHLTIAPTRTVLE